MNKKTDYSDSHEDYKSAISAGERIPDFLPPPDKLIKRNPKVKVTISLNRQSVDFFKRYAKQYNVKYQTMINEVLDQYAKRYSGYKTEITE